MTMMDYSPPWSSEAPRGNSFHYSPNSHEITALLLNNNIYAGCHEYSILWTGPGMRSWGPTHGIAKGCYSSDIFVAGYQAMV